MCNQRALSARPSAAWTAAPPLLLLTFPGLLKTAVVRKARQLERTSLSLPPLAPERHQGDQGREQLDGRYALERLPAPIGPRGRGPRKRHREPPSSTRGATVRALPSSNHHLLRNRKKEVIYRDQLKSMHQVA